MSSLNFHDGCQNSCAGAALLPLSCHVSCLYMLFGLFVCHGACRRARGQTRATWVIFATEIIQSFPLSVRWQIRKEGRKSPRLRSMNLSSHSKHKENLAAHPKHAKNLTAHSKLKNTWRCAPNITKSLTVPSKKNINFWTNRCRNQIKKRMDCNIKLKSFFAKSRAHSKHTLERKLDSALKTQNCIKTQLELDDASFQGNKSDGALFEEKNTWRAPSLYHHHVHVNWFITVMVASVLTRKDWQKCIARICRSQSWRALRLFEGY